MNATRDVPRHARPVKKYDSAWNKNTPGTVLIRASCLLSRLTTWTLITKVDMSSKPAEVLFLSFLGLFASTKLKLTFCVSFILSGSKACESTTFHDMASTFDHATRPMRMRHRLWAPRQAHCRTRTIHISVYFQAIKNKLYLQDFKSSLNPSPAWPKKNF